MANPYEIKEPNEAVTQTANTPTVKPPVPPPPPQGYQSNPTAYGSATPGMSLQPGLGNLPAAYGGSTAFPPPGPSTPPTGGGTPASAGPPPIPELAPRPPMPEWPEFPTFDIPDMPESGFTPIAPLGGGGNFSAGPLYGQMTGRVGEWIDAPSRYHSDAMQAGLDALYAQSDLARTRGSENIAEHMAGRGLIGSTMEADQMRQMNEAIGAAELNREAILAQDLAANLASDRAQAISAGMGLENLHLTRQDMAAADAVRWAGLDLDRQNLNNQGRLDWARFGEDAWQNRAGFGLDAWQAQNNAAIDRYGVDLQGWGMEQGFGLDRAGMMQDGWFQQRRNELLEKGMDQDQANWQAEMDWRRERAGVEDTQWQKGFDFDQKKWDDALGIDRTRLGIDLFGQDWFDPTVLTPGQIGGMLPGLDPSALPSFGEGGGFSGTLPPHLAGNSLDNITPGSQWSGFNQMSPEDQNAYVQYLAANGYRIDGSSRIVPLWKGQQFGP